MDNFNVMIRILANILLLGLIVVAVVLLFPKLIVLMLPFVIGYFISLIVSPMVKFCQKKLHFPRKLASIIIILLTVTLIAVLITLIIGAVVDQAVTLAKNWQDIYRSLSASLKTIADKYYGSFDLLPREIQQYMDSAVTSLGVIVSGWAGKAATSIVQNVGSFAMQIPHILIFIVILILASFFMTDEKEMVSITVKSLLTKKIIKRISIIKNEIKIVFGGYVRAQGFIMLIVFSELFLSFSIKGNRYALFLAMLIALFDALPFFGSGAFLIPWALVNFIMGDIRGGITMAATYILVILTRQFIEPKVVGDHIGLHPLITLMSMYAGLKLLGVGGMILGPIIAILVRRMYVCGMLDFIIEIIGTIWFDVMLVTGITARKNKIQKAKSTEKES